MNFHDRDKVTIIIAHCTKQYAGQMGLDHKIFSHAEANVCIYPELMATYFFF